MMADDESQCGFEEEFVLVGIEPRRGKTLGVLLAREGRWGLEYAGTGVVDLPESEMQRLLDAAEALISDYPHLKVRSRGARWLVPSLRVRARHDGNEEGRAKLAATVISLLPEATS
jgi:hypothetical protein